MKLGKCVFDDVANDRPTKNDQFNGIQSFITVCPADVLKRLCFRKKFAPYLSWLDSEQKLEKLFLEFLKQKFA